MTVCLTLLIKKRKNMYRAKTSMKQETCQC